MNGSPQPLELTPHTIVAELDKYIVGQAKAKRAVAIAMRNRYRRERVREDLRPEIIPKNILMIGPTGVGKTEIARRLAKLTAGLPVIIDLIDVNDPTGRFQPPTAEELNVFRNALTAELGMPVNRRYSGGQDIDGGCGMLAGNRGGTRDHRLAQIAERRPCGF